jgi:hypothetical protein
MRRGCYLTLTTSMGEKPDVVLVASRRTRERKE